MARFHPDAALLTAYAAGTLSEPVMLVVATHLAACPDCRAETVTLLRLGGHCVAQSTPAPVSPSCREKILKAIRFDRKAAVTEEAGGAEGDVSASADDSPASGAASVLWPRPLRGYLAHSGDPLPWKNRGFGIRVLDLPCAGKAYSCFLMDIAAGRQIPTHTHHGEEMVAVLQGAVVDPTGRFEAGDFIYGDNHILHEQASDPEAGCVCLVVLRGDVDFKGRFGPVLNAIGRVQKLF